MPQPIEESQIKSKTVMSYSSRKKKNTFIPFILSEGNFFKICVLSHCIVYWIHFQNIHTFTYQKILLHTLLLLVSTIDESLQCILKSFKSYMILFCQSVEFYHFFLRFEVFLPFFVLPCIIVSF